MYPRSENIEDSDDLRNITCHEYLLNIRKSLDAYEDIKSTFIPDEIKELIRLLPTPGDIYQSSQTYGNDYSLFMKMLDTQILAWREQYKKNNLKVYKLLSIIIEAAYHNSNEGLERAAAMVKNILLTAAEHKQPLSERIEVRMAKTKTKKAWQLLQSTNATTPHKMETGLQRLRTTHVGSLKVQHKTNIPSIRRYRYKNPTLPIEYRFGTQAQLSGNLSKGRRTPGLSPLFQSFLEVQKEKRDEQIKESKNPETISPITHIYFNNLKTKAHEQSAERAIEGSLTSALNSLPSKYDNVAVITLPADNDWISHHTLGLSDTAVTEDVLEQIKKIVGQTGSPENSDFYISPRVRALLFDNTKPAETEEKIIDDLLQKSLKKLGLFGKPKITADEKQALYFHFIKFELTNYIINKLNPVSFNMSCKDAIDRGGVSSAYYNLMKSLEMNSPLDKDEFDRALYGAPLLVKGRGMNDHVKLIWNAVNAYLANSENISAPDWLKKWCADNNPHQRAIKEADSKMEAIIALNDYIDKKLTTDVFKKSAAIKLKDMLENPQNLTIPFTRSEWKALVDSRLREVFLDVLSHLSSDQQKKMSMLMEIHNEITSLKSSFAFTQSKDFELGKKLWTYVNPDESSNITILHHELKQINNNPVLTSILEKVQSIRNIPPQEPQEMANDMLDVTIHPGTSPKN